MNAITRSGPLPKSEMNVSPAATTSSTDVAAHHAQRLWRVQQLARWLDTSFTIPGTPIRFGWDSIIGFVPGVGDAFTALTGGWILREAQRSGVSKLTLAKMVGNVAVDMTVGAIPLVGDVFDIYWKSNVRNAKLLEAHLRKTGR